MSGQNRSGLGRSADRAGLGAGAAFDAGISVNFVLAIAFLDGGNGAFGSAGTAADAFFRNLVSHWINLLIMSRFVRETVPEL